MNYKLIARRVSPLLILGAFFAASQVLIASKEEPKQAEVEEPILRVEVMEAKPQTFRFSLDSYGFVEPKYQSNIVSEISGRVLSLSPQLQVGGLVKEGEVLITIDASDYQADLEQAKASLAQAAASLEEELARAEVAKRDWAHVGESKAPKLGLRVPQVKREKANVKFAEAAVKRAERNLERTVIRAPFDGLVNARHANPGEYLTVGAPVVDLSDTSTAEVSLPIPNDDLAYLPFTDDNPLDVTLHAQIAGQSYQYPAKVYRTERVIDRNSRMFNLVADVADPYCLQSGGCKQPSLKLGSYVTASIWANEMEDIIVLPRNLVRSGMAYVVKNDDQLEQRTINIIRQDENYAYIHASFDRGEQIVVTPIAQYQPNQIVTVADAQEQEDE